MNPIDQPGFDRSQHNRRPNEQLMEEAHQLAVQWRAATAISNECRARLNGHILKLWDAGHSYGHITEATGIAPATIQLILKKMGR